MPRHVDIRPNYLADSSYLLRLIEAIELDTEQPEDWRRETAFTISRLVKLLSEASQRKIDKQLKRKR